MLGQQLTLDGRVEDVGPAHERMRLFEQGPPAMRGQMAAHLYHCKVCGAEVFSSVPTERCGAFGCDNRP